MQRRDRCCARLFGAAVAAVCGVFGAAPSMTAQGTAVASCDRFLLAPRAAGGRRVGPASCRSVETPLVFEGRALVRLDVGLDGTVEGYMPTNAPDLVFLQAADAGHGCSPWRLTNVTKARR